MSVEMLKGAVPQVRPLPPLRLTLRVAPNAAKRSSACAKLDLSRTGAEVTREVGFGAEDATVKNQVAGGGKRRPVRGTEHAAAYGARTGVVVGGIGKLGPATARKADVSSASDRRRNDNRSTGRPLLNRLAVAPSVIEPPSVVELTAPAAVPPACTSPLLSVRLLTLTIAPLRFLKIKMPAVAPEPNVRLLPAKVTVPVESATLNQRTRINDVVVRRARSQSIRPAQGSGEAGSARTIGGG